MTKVIYTGRDFTVECDGKWHISRSMDKKITWSTISCDCVFFCEFCEEDRELPHHFGKKDGKDICVDCSGFMKGTVTR